jgi:hypothetical protein
MQASAWVFTRLKFHSRRNDGQKLFRLLKALQKTQALEVVSKNNRISRRQRADIFFRRQSARGRMARPSTRRVAAKLRQAGASTSHETINRPRRAGWRPLERARHPLEAARDALERHLIRFPSPRWFPGGYTGARAHVIDPHSKRGHQNLFLTLSRVLQDNGAAHPPITILVGSDCLMRPLR